MLRLLHLADLHVGYVPDRLGERAVERGREFADAFRRAVDFALDEKKRIHGVMIAGDLFERHHPNDQDVEFVRNQLARLIEAGRPVVLIPGTHDAYYYPDSVYHGEPFPGAHLLLEPNISEPKTLNLNGEDVHFYGLAYQPSGSREPFDEFRAQELPGYHVALIHGSLKHNPNWDTYSRDVPLNVESLLKSGMHYIALGHYHSFQSYGDENCRVAYCGSLERKGHREADERKLVVVEMNGGKAGIEEHLFPARSFLKQVLEITSLPDGSPASIAEQTRRMTPEGAILRLQLEGSAEEPVDLQELEKLLQPHCFHLEIEDQTLLWRSQRLKQWAEEPTVRGLFIQRMLNKIENAEEEEAGELNLALKLALHEFSLCDENNSL